MNKRLVTAALILPATSIASAGVPTSEYRCQSPGGDALQLLMGEGEIQYWTVAGRWSGNLCENLDPCHFDGSVFDVHTEYFDLHFESGDGSIRFAAMMADPNDAEFRGTCRRL